MHTEIVLSQFSHVWLFATRWTVARQASLSMGFPREEYWSALPFPSPGNRPTQGSNLCPLHLLHWQAGSLSPVPPGKSEENNGILWTSYPVSHLVSPKCRRSQSVLRVTQSCPTLCNPMGYSLPGSSIHGILQARILEWVAIPFSRGSSQPRDWTKVSCIADRFFTIWATREATVGLSLEN